MRDDKAPVLSHFIGREMDKNLVVGTNGAPWWIGIAVPGGWRYTYDFVFVVADFII